MPALQLFLACRGISVDQGTGALTLFQVLEHELDEGRKYYEKSVDPSVAAQVDYFNLAVVDILVKGRGNVESKIW
jgi:hypothetical protein